MKQKTLENHQISIVKAESEHLPLIVPLFDAYRQFYQQSTDLEGAQAFLTKRFQEGSSVIFLAMIERKGNSTVACGFTQLYPAFSSVSMKRLWILNDLFVVPEVRQQGVGKALLEHARAFASTTQAKGLTLKTAVENYPAQALYESSGWQRDENFVSYDLRLM